MHITAFDFFIKLVETDKEILQLKAEKNSFIAQQQQLQQQLEQIQADLSRQHQTVTSIRKKIDSIELEVASLDVQLADKKARLDNAANTKQYYSLQEEIENLQKQKEQLEEPIFDLWHEVEAAQKQYDESVAKSPEKVSALQEETALLQRRIEQIGTTILSRQKEREKYLGLADNELLVRYNSLRERINNPVVPIKKDSCSACFYQINQQDLIAIRRNQLVNCRDCYRLLYSRTTV